MSLKLSHWAILLASNRREVLATVSGTTVDGKGSVGICCYANSDAGNYEAIKAAIFVRYNFNTKAYRRKFRATVHRTNETNRELAVRIGKFQAKWMRECHTVEEMAEVICLESF